MTPAWHRYREAVTTFLPAACGDELKARCLIALLRDNARHSLNTAPQEACNLLIEIERMGSIWWLAVGENDRLQIILDSMSAMYGIARRINQEFKEQ